MFSTLRAEMSRKNVTCKNLAELFEMTPQTISFKMNGKSGFTLDEAKKIKDFLGVEMSIDELFEKE